MCQRSIMFVGDDVLCLQVLPPVVQEDQGHHGA